MKTSERVHELFLNYACSAKCPFCYNPPITPELLRLDLSFRQAAASLLRASQGGARRAKALNLHGGEVTLRDDLPKILALARKLGFERITLVTNGIRLGELAYTRSLKRSGLTHVRLSVHGPDAATHDKIVAIPGAFRKVLKAVEHLRELKIPFGMNFVLIKSNVRKLPAFLEKFCLDKEVSDVIVYFPHLSGMMAINADKDGLSYGDAVPWVRRGAKALGEAGRLESLLLANFPPCVIPEMTERILDWSHRGEGTDMTHPEGFTEDLDSMKEGQRRKIDACKACSFGKECLGIETRYLARNGDEAFLPVAEAAA